MQASVQAGVQAGYVEAPVQLLQLSDLPFKLLCFLRRPLESNTSGLLEALCQQYRLALVQQSHSQDPQSICALLLALAQQHRLALEQKSHFQDLLGTCDLL